MEKVRKLPNTPRIKTRLSAAVCSPRAHRACLSRTMECLHLIHCREAHVRRKPMAQSLRGWQAVKDLSIWSIGALFFVGNFNRERSNGMRAKLIASFIILVGMVACTHMGGMEEKEKTYGKNPPVIGQSFASDQLMPGDLWKIYLRASDPDGDMHTLFAVVTQSGIGSYPVSITRIKEVNARELSGYLYLDTGGPYSDDFLNNQELTVTIQIKDKAGHTSQSVTLSAMVSNLQKMKSPPAGVFKENDLGPIMVSLKPAGGRNR